MFTHPTITQALAEQHRRDLINQASAYRLAQSARQAGPRLQSRPRLITKALRATAAAAALAGATFLITPSGPAAASVNWSGTTRYSAGNWYAHFVANSSHQAVLAVHFNGRFADSHRFGAGHLFGANDGRWA